MPLLERAWKGFLWGQAGRMSEVFLGFVFTLFISRMLGPEHYGTYVLFMSWLVILVMVSSLGLNEALGKFIPQFLEQKRWDAVVSLFRNFAAYRIAGVAALGIIALLTRDTIFPLISHLSAGLLLLALLRSVSDLYNYLFSALLDVKTNTFVRFISQLLSLGIVVFFFLAFRPSVMAVVLAAVISTALGIALYSVALVRHRPGMADDDNDNAPRGNKEQFNLLTFCASVWATGLVTFGLGNQIDKIFMSFFLKDQTVIGYYGIATLIPTSLYALLITGWGITILPVLSSAYFKYQNEGLARSWNAYFKVMFTLLIPVSVFIIGYAGHLIPLFFGKDFAPAARYMQIYFSLIVASYFFSPGLTTFSLYVLTRHNTVLALRAGGAILNVVLDIILIPRYGAQGALLATGTCIVLTFMSEFLALRSTLPFKYPFSTVIKIAGASLIALAAASSVIPANGIFGLLLNGIAYLLLLLLCFYLLKPFSRNEYDIMHRLNARFAAYLRPFLAEKGASTP